MYRSSHVSFIIASVNQPIAYAGYSYKVLILNIFRFISLLLFGGPEKDRCFCLGVLVLYCSWLLEINFAIVKV